MKFIADIHIHSRFSRATSRNMTVEQLYIAAQLKGITVLATGDITHPEWFKEISEKLEPAELCLFKLKSNIAVHFDKYVPESCRRTVRFLLGSEVSSIYKKNGKIHKIHNLLFLPDIASVKALNKKLGSIGNLSSDGRPVLRLDARNLLEILLETNDQSFLIPAHIWTPWFSLLGSKSGFDSIKDCFDDLTDQIFAVETGLSSDPEMNCRVSFLDGLTLISNSDAHSPEKIGRECNIFNTDLSYQAIRKALQSGDENSFLGTYEFYSEQGKYHMDGHRNCKICFTPEMTLHHNGICPVCKKTLTIGVLNRIEMLSSRKKGDKPEKTNPFYFRVSLLEILSEICHSGYRSKKIQQYYMNAISNLGSEQSILNSIPISDIDMLGIPKLGEAIYRMRHGKLDIQPGYDGEFGKIQILI